MEGVCKVCGTTAELNEEGKCADCAGSNMNGGDMGGGGEGDDMGSDAGGDMGGADMGSDDNMAA